MFHDLNNSGKNCTVQVARNGFLVQFASKFSRKNINDFMDEVVQNFNEKFKKTF